MPFRRTIASTLLRNWIVAATASIGLMAALWLRAEYRHSTDDIERLQALLTEGRKAELRAQVERAVNYVEFMRTQTDTRIRRELRERVEEAHALASHLWDTYRDRLPRAMLEGLVADALRAERFNGGRGYYFAFTLDGVQVFSDRPDLVGQNLSDLQDTAGAYVIRDLIRIAKSAGQGYSTYTWTRPDAPGQGFPKISYVKRFDPFGWVLGTGEYVEDTEREIQEEVVARLESVRFGHDGYIFAGTWDGISLSYPAKGRNMIGAMDPNGVHIVAELIERAKAGGGYVTYVMPKLAGERPAPKISFALPIPGWEWYVGAGAYVDDIEASVAEARAAVIARMRTSAAKALGVFALLLTAAVWVGSRVAGRTRRTFDAFTAFFRRAATESAEIDPDELSFAEFRELAVAANDMTRERRTADERLRRLAAAVEHAGDDVLLTDAGATILYVNPAFERTTGYTAAEAVGRTPSFLKSGQHDEAFYTRLWDTLHRGEVWRGQFVNRAKDGRLLHEDAAIAPIRSATGEVDGYVSTRRDVTQQLELEAHLAQAQKLEAIGTLAGGIAHDFNNMLAVMIGSTEVALMKTPPDSPVRPNLDAVLAAAERAAALVRQIVAFSRQRSQEVQDVPVASLVKEVLKLLRASLPSTIEIRSDVTSDAHVRADPADLHRVLMNLCTNAALAMRNTAGVLEVTLTDAEADSGWRTRHPDLGPAPFVLLTVRDTGCGMSAEVLSRIFEPFFTTRPTAGGTGMGLAVVHGVVHALGGAIDAQSAPGRGSTFRVLLPASTGKQERETCQLAELPCGTERVLFVDDESLVVDTATDALQRLGYRVTPFTDGPEAIRAFLSAPDAFDVVVTDVTMPGITGDELAARVKAERPSLPIILCTGYSEKVDPARAQALGVDAFALKPLTLEKLATTLRQALDGKMGRGHET